jgi:hypothetical protein
MYLFFPILARRISPTFADGFRILLYTIWYSAQQIEHKFFIMFIWCVELSTLLDVPLQNTAQHVQC